MANFLSNTFYDLKVTFGYIVESPENCKKYEYFENNNCIFWSKHGCFTAFLDILNTKRQISPELEAQILSGLYWEYTPSFFIISIRFKSN